MTIIVALIALMGGGSFGQVVLVVLVCLVLDTIVGMILAGYSANADRRADHRAAQEAARRTAAAAATAQPVVTPHWCPRCRGQRLTMLPGHPLYCVSCGWFRPRWADHPMMFLKQQIQMRLAEVAGARIVAGIV